MSSSNDNNDSSANNTEYLNKINIQLEFDSLYFDKLLILAIDKCLYTCKNHVRFEKYDKEYAQSEFIDFRSKCMEGCFDRVYALHKGFNDEILKSNEIKNKDKKGENISNIDIEKI